MCSVHKSATSKSGRDGRGSLHALCPFVSHAALGVAASKTLAPHRAQHDSSPLAQARTVIGFGGTPAPVNFFPANPKRGPPEPFL
jgi:hypothetical protein